MELIKEDFNDVIPKSICNGSFTSLCRRLNKFGFRKCFEYHPLHCYGHPEFLRNDQERMVNVRNREKAEKKLATAVRKQLDDEGEFELPPNQLLLTEIKEVLVKISDGVIGIRKSLNDSKPTGELSTPL